MLPHSAALTLPLFYTCAYIQLYNRKRWQSFLKVILLCHSGHNLLVHQLLFPAATLTDLHHVSASPRPRGQNAETPPSSGRSPKSQPLACRQTSISIGGFSSRQPINMEIKLLRIVFAPLHSGDAALGSSPLSLIIPPAVFNCI